jgi:hypothetical protein
MNNIEEDKVMAPSQDEEEKVPTNSLSFNLFPERPML